MTKKTKLNFPVRDIDSNRQLTNSRAKPQIPTFGLTSIGSQLPGYKPVLSKK
jgi:hypothetical protein